MNRRAYYLAAVAALLTLAGSAPASAALPRRVYAPYFETWKKDSVTTLAERSGVRYFTLAFLGTSRRGSCSLVWNGRKAAALRKYRADVSSLRARGGDVIVSFGGWDMDQRATEIADSCRNVRAVAAAYESVIKTYGITRLDMDVEGRSLHRFAGIDRRNKAIKLVEDWATAHKRPLQIGYTLPTSAYGLGPNSFAILTNAVANGARIDVVNVMTFDYYDGITVDMGDAAITAAQGLFEQLKALYPTKSEAELWSMEGNTMMTGIDDYPQQTEVTSPFDAQVLYDFAKSVGIGTLSIWSAQRDAPAWSFSRLLASYTRP